MQKLVFFIESTDKAYGLASTICNLYMNRFTIDEDAGHEIHNIYKVDDFCPVRDFYRLTVEKKEQEGIGRITLKNY